MAISFMVGVTIVMSGMIDMVGTVG